MAGLVRLVNDLCPWRRLPRRERGERIHTIPELEARLLLPHEFVPVFPARFVRRIRVEAVERKGEERDRDVGDMQHRMRDVPRLAKPRPRNERRRTHAALPQRAFHAAERPITGHVRVKAFCGSSVVRREEYDGVFHHPRALEGVGDVAHALVQARDHSRHDAAVQARPFRLPRGAIGGDRSIEGVSVRIRHLVGRMDSLPGEVHEKRSTCCGRGMLLDDALRA